LNTVTFALTSAAFGALLLASPAARADVPPRPPVAEAPAEHGAPAAHGAAAAHGEAAAHIDPKTNYVGDDDGDGVPNWRDRDAEAYQLTKLLLHGFNLALLLGVLWWLAGRAVSDALRNRAANIRKSIVDAAEAKAAAQTRFDELEARLAAFEGEVLALREQAVADAQEEEARMVAHAKAEAERILVTADRNIRDEVVRARMALRNDAVELAVKLAAETLRSNIATADQQKLASEFLSSLNHGVSNHG